jgi:hypothetical protein
MENNRNLFITIILSVVILAAWQIFYIGPKIEAEKQAQLELQAQQETVAPTQTPAATADGSLPQPTTQGEAALPRPGGEQRNPARSRPHHNRHADADRLDQSARRAFRRPEAEGIPRDDRQGFRHRHAAEARQRSRRLYRRVRLSRRRGRTGLGRSLAGRRGRDADSRIPGGTDLHGSKRPGLH